MYSIIIFTAVAVQQKKQLWRVEPSTCCCIRNWIVCAICGTFYAIYKHQKSTGLSVKLQQHVGRAAGHSCFFVRHNEANARARVVMTLLLSPRKGHVCVSGGGPARLECQLF
jgi:hypothetical protein